MYFQVDFKAVEFMNFYSSGLWLAYWFKWAQQLKEASLNKLLRQPNGLAVVAAVFACR